MRGVRATEINPDCKLTDFSAEQLEAVGKALNASMALGLVKDYERGYVNEFFVQILNATNTVNYRNKISNT